MLLLLTLILAALLAVFLSKWLLLRREVRSITHTIRDLHGSGSNRRITVGSQDKAVAELALAVNQLYDDRYREQGEHVHAMAEIRRNMANISHDLRTPLTSIIGYVGLLRQGGNTPEQAERYLSVIDGKAASLNQLVGSLFDLARLESGAYPFTMEPLDAGEILTEELAGFYEAFPAGADHPDIRLDPGPLRMVGDRSALGRVFSNLLRNMLQHGGSEIRIASGRGGGRITFSFSNRANRLTDSDVENLFRRFYVADPVRTRDNTGLGLAIVKEFVQQMDGEIAAGLEDGVLTFTLDWKELK